MSFILNIDTAVDTASVCLSSGTTILGVEENPSARDSAAWLHLSIQQLLQHQALTVQQLSAVAVSAGPGSYTGLRVGMAAAKGLCYAAGLPLITLNTLQIMAAAAAKEATGLLCPMIDARRMEVFTALYTPDLQEVMPATALVLNEHSFDDYITDKKITFFGNGSTKYAALINHPNAIFKTVTITATYMPILANSFFIQKKFTNLAYSEPFYGKEFFTNALNI